MNYSSRNKTLGESIYSKIDNNEYLNELYNKLLRNYSRKIFRREIEKFSADELNDLLRFADILSKSTDKHKKGDHKIWAQQIVALLDKLYPNNEFIELYKTSVLTVCNNFQGMKNDKNKLVDNNILERSATQADKQYFQVPNHPDDYFFEDQKRVYDCMHDGHLSYSAPTSQGKSYVMKVFIKEKIINGCQENFAIIVPTKALINETRHKMLAELKDENTSTKLNYRIVTSTGDIALEQDHHFIYIMTPERFLYLLNTTEHTASYIFIDEAHKISAKDKRSAFYYQVVSKLMKMDMEPVICFASPNIPNPEEYLKLIAGDHVKKNIHSEYAPVSQIKQIIDCHSGLIEIYNDFSKEFIKIGNNSQKTLNEIINYIGKDEQNLVYCNSLKEAIDQAVKYGETADYLNDESLDKLANDIKTEISSDYFLVDLLRKGIAYHVGYLPASIRARIEDAYKRGIIKTLFCTSTLIEGVNLPADNLFITSHQNGRSNFDEVTFRNLIGRVGRIDHSLFGNVFLVNLENKDKKIEKYKELLKKEVPTQKLSVETTLTKNQKKTVVNSLINGDFEMNSRPSNTTSNQYDFMRKMATTIIDELKEGTTSVVTDSFSEELTDEAKVKITKKYKDIELSQGINITPDQTVILKEFIKNGGSYPKRLPNGYFDWDSTLYFLNQLAKIFKWDVYEHSSIGRLNFYGEFASLYYYGDLLEKWMSGYGLNLIIKSAIEYKTNHPESGIWINGYRIEDYFNALNKKHVNYVIAEALSNIENVILFTFANYFREFSTEYKLFHRIDHFDNDWYEYVEYGTTNLLTITLQRNGYTREAARYIIDHKEKFVVQNTSNSNFALRLKNLLECDNENVKMESEDIAINEPELFC